MSLLTTVEWFKPTEMPELLKVFYSIQKSIKNPAFFNWSEDSFSQELKVSKTLVCKHQGQIAAFLSFRQGIDSFEIMVLGTEVSFQKQGAMSSLMGWFLNYAAQQNKDVWLEVHEQNKAALQTYSKFSFVLTQKRKNYYKDGASADVLLWTNKS
jgi:[ribosomal protein S18]-alanine N-acetyltransferase